MAQPISNLDIEDLTDSFNKTLFNANQFKNAMRGSKPPKTKKKKIIAKKSSKEATQKAIDWDLVNKQTFEELNRVRMNPKSLIPRMEFIANHIKNGVYYPPNSKIGVVYKEKVSVVKEAIVFLNKQSKRRPLVLCQGLCDAASIHVTDQGKSGGTGHIGSNGMKPAERMNEVHRDKGMHWKIECAENIMYGRENGRDIVCALIIDDGVKSRGHRTNMFGDQWRMVGIRSGPHPKFRTLCVLDFAVDYGE